MLDVGRCAKQVNTGIKFGGSAGNGAKQAMVASSVQAGMTGLCQLDPFDTGTDTDFRPIRLPRRRHGCPSRQKCLQQQRSQQQLGKQEFDGLRYKHGKEILPRQYCPT